MHDAPAAKLTRPAEQKETTSRDVTGRRMQNAGRFRLTDTTVFNKLVITALKFTPMVVAHHIPYKTLPGGKLQVPVSSPSPSPSPPPFRSHHRLLPTVIVAVAVAVAVAVVVLVLTTAAKSRSPKTSTPVCPNTFSPTSPPSFTLSDPSLRPLRPPLPLGPKMAAC